MWTVDAQVDIKQYYIRLSREVIFHSSLFCPLSGTVIIQAFVNLSVAPEPDVLA